MTRTPYEAAGSLLDALQLAASCCTRSVLRPNSLGYLPRAEPHRIAFPEGAAVLQASPPVALVARHWYRLIEEADGWRARTAGYHYGLVELSGAEILVYHWHPEGRSHEIAPHIHLGAGALVGRAPLAAAHVRSGLVTVSAAIHLAVALGAAPRRRAWRGLLDEADRAITSL